MKNITIFVLILVFTGGIPLSCGCGFGSDGARDFRIVKFGVLTTSASAAEVDPSLTYGFDNVFKTLFIAERKTAAVNLFHFNSTFTSTALACSPEPARAIEKFQDIRLITLTDIHLKDGNDAIQAGQDITDRFRIHYNMHSNDFIAIADFLDSAPALYDDARVMVRLAEKPFQEVKLKLKIVVTLTDARTFEFDNEGLNVM